MLQFNFNKREKTRKVGFIIFEVAEHLKLLNPIMDKCDKDNEIHSNLNYNYLLVGHVYIGEKIVEECLAK